MVVICNIVKSCLDSNELSDLQISCSSELEFDSVEFCLDSNMFWCQQKLYILKKNSTRIPRKRKEKHSAFRNNSVFLHKATKRTCHCKCRNKNCYRNLKTVFKKNIVSGVLNISQNTNNCQFNKLILIIETHLERV